MPEGTFDNLNPPKKVTDPAGSAGGEYPRHLHKYAGPDAINDYVVVKNDDEKAARLKEGYALVPVLEAPAVKESAAKKKSAKGDDDPAA